MLQRQTVEPKTLSLLKDFIDLAFLLDLFTLEEIFEFLQKKYPTVEPFMVMRSLIWFEDAEEDLDPKMLQGRTWEKVKSDLKSKLDKFT